MGWTWRAVFRKSFKRPIATKANVNRSLLGKEHLNLEHRKSRLTFPLKHVNYNMNQWSCVLFSDESKFRLTRYDGRIRVWAGRGGRIPKESFKRPTGTKSNVNRLFCPPELYVALRLAFWTSDNFPEIHSSQFLMRNLDSRCPPKVFFEIFSSRSSPTFSTIDAKTVLPNVFSVFYTDQLFYIIFQFPRT